MDDQELIRQVAEKVMGWIEGKDYFLEYYGPEGQFSGIWLINDKGLAGEEWLPLTNANHRDMVVERMRELGWNIEIFSIRDFWRIRFLHPVFVNKDSEVDNNNLAHAVCLAALKALE